MRCALLLLVTLQLCGCLSVAGRRPDPADPQQRSCSPRWTGPADVGLGLAVVGAGVAMIATAPTDGYYIATPTGIGRAGMFTIVGGLSQALAGVIVWAAGGPQSSVFRTCPSAR